MVAWVFKEREEEEEMEHSEGRERGGGGGEGPRVAPSSALSPSISRPLEREREREGGLLFSGPVAWTGKGALLFSAASPRRRTTEWSEVLFFPLVFPAPERARGLESRRRRERGERERGKGARVCERERSVQVGEDFVGSG